MPVYMFDHNSCPRGEIVQTSHRFGIKYNFLSCAHEAQDFGVTLLCKMTALPFELFPNGNVSMSKTCLPD